MFNTAFDDLVPEKKGINYYPEYLQRDIDSVNEWVYDTVNNGVYKTGFAAQQSVCKYAKGVNVVGRSSCVQITDENHCRNLFQSLDRLESMLEKSDFLVGNTFTEADIRLWTTIIRFDPVYFGHFKCNIKSIAKDYPNLLRWARMVG
jgi:glutathionyl-hydroquinone reductase